MLFEGSAAKTGRVQAAPRDATLEAVLPIVHRRFDEADAKFDALIREQREIAVELERSLLMLQNDTQVLLNDTFRKICFFIDDMIKMSLSSENSQSTPGSLLTSAQSLTTSESQMSQTTENDIQASNKTMTEDATLRNLRAALTDAGFQVYYSATRDASLPTLRKIIDGRFDKVDAKMGALRQLSKENLVKAERLSLIVQPQNIQASNEMMIGNDAMNDAFRKLGDASAIAAGGSKEPSRKSESTPESRIPRPRVPRTTTTAPWTSAFSGCSFKLPCKPRSATHVWNAWHAIGPCDNDPVPGGIPTLESEFPGWRKKYPVNERKKFSRYNIAVRLMKEEALLHGGDMDITLAHMDSIFRAISPFVKTLQARKKARASAAAAASARAATAASAVSSPP